MEKKPGFFVAPDAIRISLLHPILPVLLVSLGAFALRLYRLDAQSLWWDEAFSITLAEKGLVDITFGDFHPPLYHYLLHFWLAQVGKTEFAARFLSVVCGTLIVPLAYRLGRRLFDRRTGAIGALLVALSPVHLWYGQETRMHILLALHYGALLYLFHRLTDDRRQRTDDRFWWIALVGVELVALYNHYFSAIVIAYLTAMVLIHAAADCRYAAADCRYAAAVHAAADCRWWLPARWVGAQILVGLLYLPWLPIALPLMAAYKPEGAQAPQLLEFVLQVWHFFNGGILSLAGNHKRFTDLSSLTAGLFVVLVFILWWRDQHRRRSLQLLAHAAVPLALIFLLMQARPGFHPRSIVMLATPILLLVGRGLSLLSQGALLEQVIAAAMASAFLTTFAVGFQATVVDPRYQREDVRSLAHHLEREAGSLDLILFGYEDDAFHYYYRGNAPVASLDLKAPDEQIATRLADLALGRGEIWLVTWDQAPVDKRGILPWLLERSGRAVGHWYSPGLRAEVYRPEDIPALPALDSTPYGSGQGEAWPTVRSTNGSGQGEAWPTVGQTEFGTVADFGPVTLVGSFYESAPAGEVIPVALRWRSTSLLDQTYRATVVLEDQKGRRIASKDRVLLDQLGRRTADWSPGTEAVNYYLLALPVGTPPVSYRLRVGVYETSSFKNLDLRDAAGAPAGQRFDLGSVRTGRSVTVLEGVPLEAGFTPVGRPVADGLMLQGYTLDRSESHAGQTLGVALRWAADHGDLPDYSPTLRLVQRDRVVAEAAGRPVYGTYPTNEWASGEIVVEWRDLTVAPDALKGTAVLELLVGSSITTLGEVPVIVSEHHFSLPPMEYRMNVSFGDFARLVGYDLDCAEVAAGGTVRLTLYWQSINDDPVDVSYTVFTHLLGGDGRMVAQHDGLPAAGMRPTTSWSQGEVITDIHDMVFVVPNYQGEAQIEVGLYDLTTMTRVTTPNGEDRVLLSSLIEVTAGE